MESDTTKALAGVADEKLFDSWFDPIETALRTRVRGFIETMIEEELETALSQPRYGRRQGPAAADNAAAPIAGHRHGHRVRSLTGTFGRPRSPSRVPGSSARTARRPSGRARRYEPIGAAPAPPML
jgi:hypothetical protein